MDRFKSNNIFFHVVGSGVVFINHISSHFYHYCILIHLDYVFMCERRFMLCSVSCFCCILCEDSEQECSKKPYTLAIRRKDYWGRFVNIYLDLWYLLQVVRKWQWKMSTGEHLWIRWVSQWAAKFWGWMHLLVCQT